MIPRPYQIEAVQSLFDYFKSGAKGNPFIAMPTGCHALGSKLLMFDGSTKKVEKIKVGDLLMGPDSMPRQVLNLARGRENMVRVKPTKGESFVVNENHILSLLHNDGDKKKIHNVSLKEYLSKSKTFKHCAKLRRVPVTFSNCQILPLHPYYLGVILGDGSTLNGGVNITTADCEIVHIIEHIAKDFDLSLTIQTKPNNKASSYHLVNQKGRPNPLSSLLKTIGCYGKTSEFKSVPHVYKTASVSDRLWLIAGLLDTDGHRTNNCFDFISKSKELSYDLQFLCRSVGLSCQVVECEKGCQTGAIGTYWRCSVSGNTEIIPNQVVRQQCTTRGQKKDVLVTGFTIECLPEDDFYGFELTGDHLYLDENFVVHHNTGKSIIPPMFMSAVLKQWPNQRMIMLTHVKELIEQNHKALLKIWPTAPVGIYSSGLGQKEAFAPLVFGGIASVKNNISAIGHRDILFIDEAHLLSPNESSMYQTVIAELKLFNPCLRVVGLSATPFRMGFGRITDGGLFTDLIYDLTGVEAFNHLIDEYYLSTLIPRQTHNVIDVSDVRQLAYDFNQGDLANTISKQNITQRALVETYDIARNRKSWVVFGAGIENCEKITELLLQMGVSATCVHSRISDEDRDNRLEAFKLGNFKAIVSNNILTTGFDHPQVDCIVDLRPTTSVVLHVQKYGRGTRPYFHPSFSYDQLYSKEGRYNAIQMGGKQNCIVLDFAGNTERLGPINDPQIPKRKGKKTGEIPIKLCNSCGAYNHISARHCIDCGLEFVFRVKIKAQSTTSEIIRSNESKTEIFPVTQCFAAIHHKAGKHDTLKLQYWSGLKLFNHWLDFAGIGFPKHKAHDWWRQHCGDNFPLNAQEALDRFGECRQAKEITVNTSGKYPQILEFLF